MIVLCLWLTFAASSFGILCFNYVYARRAVKTAWNVRIDKRFLPRISIIVPTYNEIEIIDYKLRNLRKLEYPKDLFEVVFIDSQSSDKTVSAVQKFIEENQDINAKIIVEKERKGKSSALNAALNKCTGDVVVISDADCFWNPTILLESLPYLADNSIGAISGPKNLLNAADSWITKSEDRYLRSANIMKLGDSKKSSTILFEGGFSAYKRDALETFDPYGTGSDDCGTVVKILEKNLRAIMVPEGMFFSTFPRDWKSNIILKTRRANQIVRVLSRYCVLLLKGKIATSKGVIIRNLLTYYLAPILFLFLVVTTPFLVLEFPLALLLLSAFLIPKVGAYLFEAVQGYLVMISSIISAIARKSYMAWKKPRDRQLVTEDALLDKELI